VEKVDTRLTQLAKKMEGHEWIVNDRFSVADIYLFVVTRWFDFLKIDLGRWPVIAAHHARVRARPATQAALAAEHLA
jgi:glutathione S-transferase